MFGEKNVILNQVVITAWNSRQRNFLHTCKQLLYQPGAQGFSGVQIQDGRPADSLDL